MPYTKHLVPKVLVGRVTFKDDGKAVRVLSMPKKAVLLDLKLHVLTAFNDSGGDLLDIGTDSNASYFVSGADVASAGLSTPTLSHGGVQLVAGPTLEVFATYNGANNDATAGEVMVIATVADPTLK